MTYLYLIRHGRPAAGWGEDDDPGLDDVGRSQAQQVAQWLTQRPDAQRPRHVVSSPLRRCRETAEPFARSLGLAIEIDPAVGEIPTPAGLPASSRPAWLREAMAGDWSGIKGDIDYAAWRDRVAEALVRHAGAAVFSHFVAINAALSALAQDPRVIVFRPDHTSVTVLSVGPEGLSLVERGAEAATRVL
jgi:broad specificity phosphatase PhoE